MEKNIVIYGQVSCTDRSSYLLGYEEDDPYTGGVLRIKDNGEREPKILF